MANRSLCSRGLSGHPESQAAGSTPAGDAADKDPSRGATHEEFVAEQLKHGTDRAIRAAGPTADADALRVAYLDLLKLALCDLAAARTLSVTRTGNLRDPETRIYTEELTAEKLSLRARGADWPYAGLSMIGLERLDDLQACVEAIVADGVAGDVIECGVWRGGASLLARATLDALGDDRLVWLADSFQGLPPPDLESFPQDRELDLSRFEYLAVSAEEVLGYFKRFGLDHGVRVIEGLFDETLPSLRGRRWSLLRLDGDTYESTWVALDALYPSLSAGGYVIVDDYRLIRECRAAVDDYRREHGITEPVEKNDWNSARWRRQDKPAEQPATFTTEATPREARPRATTHASTQIPTERELALEREVNELRERLHDAGLGRREP
jgi:O-methyltransferase